MLNFTYYTPTKVHFGKDTHKEVGKIIKDYGFKTIMMQYGQSTIKKSGLYDEIKSSLSENGIKVIEMGGVEPNPKLSFVKEAVKVAKENNQNDDFLRRVTLYTFRIECRDPKQK